MQGTREISHGARRLITHPYLYIFLAAALLRLFLFALMVDQAGSPDRFSEFPPDARFYLASADSIRADFNFQTRGVRVFGPGYPALLAVMGSIVGTSAGALIPLQILLTGIGSILLAMLAFRLTGDRRIAVVAGLLNALSLTGTSLANMLISDSLFFVLFVIGLLLFLHGLDDGRQRWLWLSGVALGVCTLTRSVAFSSFVILAALAVTYGVHEDENWRALLRRRLKPWVITSACLLLIAGAWMLRNHQHYGVSYLSQATAAGMVRMSAVIRADLKEASFEHAFQAFGDSVTARATITGNEHSAYVDVAREQFSRLVREHPLTSLKAYLRMLDEGVHSDRSGLSALLPRWHDQIASTARWFERLGLSFRVTILSALGFILLYRRKHRRLAISLSVIYLYFALLAGLNPLQGNRVFYPGQIAWSMLVAVALLWIYEAVQARWLRRVQSAQTSHA